MKIELGRFENALAQKDAEIATLKAKLAVWEKDIPDKQALNSAAAKVGIILEFKCPCYDGDIEDGCSCNEQAEAIVTRDWLRRIAASRGDGNDQP